MYIKNKTKLSWSIRQSTIYDENKTGNDVFDRISIPKMRQDNNVTYFTRSMLKTKLSCNDWSDRVWSITKTRQDNDVTDHIGAVYVLFKIKLSSLIEHDAVNHKHQTEQWHDQSYRCDLHWIWYRIAMTKWTLYGLWRRWEMTMTWLIEQVHSTPKMKINYHDRSDRVRSIMKTK